MLQPLVMPFILSEGDYGSDNLYWKGIAMNGNGNPKMPAHLPPLETKLTSNGALFVPNSTTPVSQDLPNGTPPTSSFLPNQMRSASPVSIAPHKVIDTSLRIPSHPHRRSSPARFSHPPTIPTSPSATDGPPRANPPPPLQHRHTLEVPLHSVPRVSKEQYHRGSEESNFASHANGGLSPSTPKSRHASISLGRRITRSLHSDLHLDDMMPQDEDASRWAETIKQKRASRRRRKEEEDDDRVVVGTKVDQNHVNWVTAYNMLTGIRFTVSRTNAKIPPANGPTPAHFTANYKFSFDVTGNELTPSAKYDFKFKDYAPEVFRSLRSHFGLDPADYLMSLTSKYILSELGSPGKSGSFFYFSRDYKYIIKTIHHAEHVLLRKVLKQYYDHVLANPNTLLSQFYGLHRVKIPYGRKIHFVVMNNLFPPHRDIHRTFDLKGSTIGRDFHEEALEFHPRATLKDLNWRRRNMHLELGPRKKRIFIEQMEKDVALLRKLNIMDYSLLVGIHDMERGNEENLRDKTLQVFQPGGDEIEEAQLPGTLQRTPSKLESVRKAKELRQNLKNQKPVPMGRSSSKMPDELPDAVVDERKNYFFTIDDGGFRATHEDDSPGEEIYYLGIIDCLTKYNIVKRSEHFFKGLVNNEKEISAIPPQRYGARFVDFIGSITVPKEQQVNEEKVIDRDSDRVRTTIDSGGSIEGTVLPVVEEGAESGSMGGRSGGSPERGPEETQTEKTMEKGKGKGRWDPR